MEKGVEWIVKKRITFVVLLVMMLAFLTTAMADTLTIPDPKAMGYSIWFIRSLDDEHTNIRLYMMDDIAQAEDAVDAYVDQLKQYEEMSYVVCTTNPDGWIYHIFEVAEGFSYDEFYLYEGQWKTVDSCVIIQYMPGNREIYFYFSTDFTMASEASEVTSRPTATSTALFTEKPTATPTAEPAAEPTVKPTAAPTAKPTETKQSCTVCLGTGRCRKCGGDMFVTGYEWVYVNGSPVSQLKTKMCQAVHCVGGSCGKCGGDGWIEE